MNIICNPISNIPRHPKSHTRGWSDHWAHLLGAKVVCNVMDGILDADITYVDHGVNFGGTVNLFGGLTDAIVIKLNTLRLAKNIVSLDVPMPKYGEEFRKRIGNKTTSQLVTEQWCIDIDRDFENVRTLRQCDLDLEGVTIGDSHATAFAGVGHKVLRKNGRTLHGAVYQDGGLAALVPNDLNLNHIRFCMGSIDIRHHALRHDLAQLEDTIWNYVQQGEEIGQKHGAWTSFCYAVPVEHENRRIPKTGYYNGEPFFGSREERLEVTDWFNELLRTATSGAVIAPPKDWYHMDGLEYSKEIMELGSSVHIAPPNYARYNWGRLDV
jgi:hypothetical protein